MEAVVFMLCLTLHNVEEALWLVDWRNTTMLITHGSSGFLDTRPGVCYYDNIDAP